MSAAADVSQFFLSFCFSCISMNESADLSLNAVPLIRNGWMQGVRIVRSTHFNRRPEGEISLLVIHNISLPPGQFGGGYVERFFAGCLPVAEDPYFETIRDLEVSSHFFIARTGEVVQFVSCLERAWHAGKSCFDGRFACNDFAVGIELEGTDTLPYTDFQYRSLEFLTLALMRAYPDITPERITGHQNIAPERKTDPGPSFDWKRFKDVILSPGRNF